MRATLSPMTCVTIAISTASRTRVAENDGVRSFASRDDSYTWATTRPSRSARRRRTATWAHERAGPALSADVRKSGIQEPDPLVRQGADLSRCADHPSRGRASSTSRYLDPKRSLSAQDVEGRCIEGTGSSSDTRRETRRCRCWIAGQPAVPWVSTRLAMSRVARNLSSRPGRVS